MHPQRNHKAHFQDDRDHDHHPHFDDHDHLFGNSGTQTGTSNRPYRLFPAKPRRAPCTRACTWLTVTLCIVLWGLITVGGLAVLVVYLLFRPKSPRFEIASVTLNGAYLDTGTLLNADLTILANFTNPNHRINVRFRYVEIDLYFEGALIATQGIGGFSEQHGESTLRSLNMVTSEVALSVNQARLWSREVGAADGVKMQVKGTFLVTSDFVGTFLHIPYSLYVRCNIAVGGPPNGVLLSSNCTSKH